jgi:hypothetical protein
MLSYNLHKLELLEGSRIAMVVDEVECEVENELFLQLTAEEFMPVSERQFSSLKTDLERQLKDLREEMDRQFRESRKENDSSRTVLHEMKGSLGALRWIAGIVGGVLLTAMVGAFWGEVKLHERVAHLEGENHEPLGAAIKRIEAPASQDQLVANLNLLAAQAQLLTAEGKSPDPAKLAPLRKALVKESADHADLPQTWRAVASVASYRTVSIQLKSKVLPDCDMNAQPRSVYAEEFPEIVPLLGQDRDAFGYVFKGCRVHMDQLPRGLGSPMRNTVKGISPADPRISPGSEVIIGRFAFFFDCEIVLNDAGISQTDIIDIFVFNCRFKYELNVVPSPNTRNFLLASLKDDEPGSFSLSLASGQRPGRPS